jgi:phenylalanine-4-hydroxylase
MALQAEAIIPSVDGWIIDQGWNAYTDGEHEVWNRLWTRQTELLADRAAPEFLQGIEKLGLEVSGIPDFAQLSARLQPLTGWRVVPVAGLVPDEVFFAMLAKRIFPAGRFIRTPEQLDYLQEPDVFHDVFGHAPMLAHPVFADYMQAYGKGGLRAFSLGSLDHLARLYWYTVEFGLIRAGQGLKLYGAGLVSSFSESIYALDDPSPSRVAFDLKRVMRTRYKIDDFQRRYFIIDSFETLLSTTLETDFAPLYRELETLPDLDPED